MNKDELLEQHTHAQAMLEIAEDPSELEFWRMEVLTIEDALAGCDE